MSASKLFFVFLVLLIFLVPIFAPESFASDSDSANSAIEQAEDVMASAYEAVLEAEQVGANVSSLLARLNVAAENLANAHIWHGLGDFENATHFANLCYNLGKEVRSEAHKLKIEAYGTHVTSLWMRDVISLVAISGIILSSFLGWYVFKQRYHKRMLRMKPRVRARRLVKMSLDEYRTVFLAAGLILIMIVTFPMLSKVFSFSSSRECFSEFWLLDSEHAAENFPFNVRVGEMQGPIYLGVGNHMGCSEYYVIYVKFRNQTQQPPSSIASKPSPLTPLYEFQFFLADDEAWEAPLNFTTQNISLQEDSIFVSNISINGVTFPVNCPSTWDSKNKGFYYQLFFELWIYDLANSSFQFHSRFVGIWLNITV